jgi:putative ABC transport system permease protein
MLDDVRFALRMMRKSPGVTAVAVVTMALGIGATTAIFSVLNAVLLEPLPYPAAERLVAISEARVTRPGVQSSISVPDYLDWRAQATSFDGLAAYYSMSVVRTDGAEPEHLAAGSVSANFFETLGVVPAAGRGFLPNEEALGEHRVALLGYDYWRRAFGADPEAVGRSILLEGERFEIVGILPAGFHMPLLDAEPAVWVPLGYGPDDLQRGAHFMRAIGRLAPGVDAVQADADLDAVAARLAELYPDENAGHSASLTPLREQIVGDVRTPLLVLLGAVALVLAIACANVANLLLARASTRHQEVAVRMALGAARWRVIRQLLLESLAIAIAGGAAGLLLATWSVDALVALYPQGLPRTAPIGIDLGVLAFAAAISVATGLIFGIVPALQASDVALHEALKSGGRGSTAARNRTSAAFVVVQVALSLVLLVGSGLLLRSLYLLSSVDPGFDPDGVLTARVSLPDSTYEDSARQVEFAYELAARLRQSPGVEAAGVGYPIPFSQSNLSLSYFRPEQPPVDAAATTSANWRPVTPGYFQALRMPLLRGRDIADSDGAEAQPVMVVNETLARRCFGDEDPIGRRLTIGYNDLTLEIVGIVGDVRSSTLEREPAPEMFTPFAQTPLSSVAVFARTSGDPGSLAPQVRATVRALDRNLAVYDVQTMAARLSTSLDRQRFSAALLGLFAAVALVLSAVGIYGVMSYTIEKRTREIGVLMALGAQQRDVLRLVVGRGMALALAGVGAGVLGAIVLSRALSGMLYGVSETDPLAFAATTLVLAAVAFVACYIPARRAARIDPAVALRSE